MNVDQRYDDGSGDRPGDPSWASPYVDGAWGRTANPNTADGQLQNITAFCSGLTRLHGSRRTAARVIVWLILIGIAVTIVDEIFGMVFTW